MLKYVVGVLALCAFASISKNSFAYLEFCDKRTDQGVWIAFSLYTPGVHSILDVTSPQATCADDTLQGENGGNCGFNSWRTYAWYHVTPGQCITPVSGALTNQYLYYFGELDDGQVYGGTEPFWVHNPAFTWDQYVSSYTSGQCAQSNGGNLAVCSDDSQASFAEANTGGNSSEIVNFN
jgi:hypothetical protein